MTSVRAYSGCQVEVYFYRALLVQVLSLSFRDILSISSEVFCSMFYGPIAKSKGQKKSIVDDDIDPVAFRLMLRWVNFFSENINSNSWTNISVCDAFVYFTGSSIPRASSTMTN